MALQHPLGDPWATLGWSSTPLHCPIQCPEADRNGQSSTPSGISKLRSPALGSPSLSRSGTWTDPKWTTGARAD
eukprot:3776047-Pyramimonas_sp.AAC.1